MSTDQDSVYIKSTLIISVIGALLYSALAYDAFYIRQYDNFGTNIYDELFLSILDGRIGLPARVLRFEGHYNSDGIGVLYHGFAPLITRFLFGWFQPLLNNGLAATSILFWSLLGSLVYQITLKYLFMAKLGNIQFKLYYFLGLSIAIWFTSPGLMLSANNVFYHEPISVSYACSAIFLYILFTKMSKNLNIFWIVVAAVVAGIALHARPNVAVGLYLGTLLLLFFYLKQQKTKYSVAITFPALILLIFGLSFLAVNNARFGSPLKVHGDYEDALVQYGPVYWGIEDAESERAQGFEQHGKFNIKRIVPNSIVYLFELPSGLFPSEFNETILELHSHWTRPYVGYVRVESGIGIVFIWFGWLALCLLSIKHCKYYLKKNSIFFISTATILLITLSYGTVTLRYRFDIWPFFIGWALISIPETIPIIQNSFKAKRVEWRCVCLLLLLFWIAGSIKYAASYSNKFAEEPDSFFQKWDYKYCVQLGNENGISLSQLSQICHLDLKD